MLLYLFCREWDRARERERERAAWPYKSNKPVINYNRLSSVRIHICMYVCMYVVFSLCYWFIHSISMMPKFDIVPWYHIVDIWKRIERRIHWHTEIISIYDDIWYTLLKLWEIIHY